MRRILTGTALIALLLLWDIVCWAFLLFWQKSPTTRTLLAPEPALLVLVAQGVALFLFAANLRTSLRWVSLLLPILIALLAIAYDWFHPKELVLINWAELPLSIGFNIIWLRAATEIAAAARAPSMASQFRTLTVVLPAILGIHWLLDLTQVSGTSALYSIVTIALLIIDGWALIAAAVLGAALFNTKGVLLHTVDSHPPVEAESAWIKTIAAGLALMWVLTVVRYCLANADFFSPLESRRARVSGAGFADPIMSLIVAAVLRLPELLAIWWMTVPPPPQAPGDNEESQSRRSWLRFLTICLIAGRLMPALYGFAGATPSVLVTRTTTAIFMIHIFLFYSYIEKDLGPLIENDDLKAHARIQKWIWPATTMLSELLFSPERRTGCRPIVTTPSALPTN
jgi:hypothetical protein